MAAPKHKSVLDNNDLVRLSNFISSEKDGVEYINVDKSAKTELGRKLSTTCPIYLRTPFGTVGTIRGFMDAIGIKGYDPRFLAKAKLTREQMASIPKEKIDVPNYWACVAYITCERVFKDQELRDMMLKNELPYECFSGAKKNILYGNEVWTVRTNRWLARYIGILRLITDLIKNSKWNKDEAAKLIESCKDDPTKDVFDSISLAIPKPVKKVVEVQEPAKMSVPGQTIKI